MYKFEADVGRGLGGLDLVILLEEIGGSSAFCLRIMRRKMSAESALGGASQTTECLRQMSVEGLKKGATRELEAWAAHPRE